MALCFVSLLSPIVRALPGRAAQLAGSAAWLSPLIALAPLALLTLMLSHMLKRRGEGEGMGEVILRVLGPVFGRLTLTLFALWLAGYSGFLIRSDAERFVSTVYPNGKPWIIIAVLLTMALVVAIGRMRPLARMAEIFRTLLLVALVVILILAIPGVEVENLLPLSFNNDSPGIVYGAAMIANNVSVFAYLSFVEGRTKRESRRSRSYLITIALILVLVTLLIAAVVGTFGAELTAKLDKPFFAMVRGVRVLGAFEHVDAAVIALWMISDFVLAALSLFISADLLRLVFGAGKKTAMVWICAAISGASAVMMAHTSFDAKYVSDVVIPLLNMVFVFGFLPVIFVVGLIRKKR